jgi:hypothetical protein
MDTGSLVENRIADGRYLLEKLGGAGFDVSAAAWVQTANDEKWGLYVVSKAVDELGLSAAYGATRTILGQARDPRIPRESLHLVYPDSPLGRELVERQRRYRDYPDPVHLVLLRLGNLAALEAYLYPPKALEPSSQQPLTPQEVAQKVVELMGRTGQVRPSRVTLRDGTTFLGVPFGLELNGGTLVVKFVVEGPESPRAYPAETIKTIE